jgi:hypothetical protein
MTAFDLRVHAKIVAMQHLLQNLYYMQYRAANATCEEISAHHAEMLKTVTDDLRQGISELDPMADMEVAKTIANAVEAELDKNLTAIRAMWATTQRA